MTLNYIIVLLCILILLGYTLTKNFDSFKGFLIFILALLALYLKNKASGFPGDIFYYQPAFVNAVYWGLFTVGVGIFLIFLFRNHKPVGGVKRLLLLAVLYLPFGILQQIFFLYLFYDSLVLIFGMNIFTFLAGVIFFTAAHMPKETAKITIFTFVFGFLNIVSFHYFKNLLVIGVVHAILGSLYYNYVHPSDRLKSRINFLKTKEVNK